MKNVGKILLVITMILLLTTGCVKYNVNMEINDDKSVSLEIIYAMDISYFEDFEDEDSEETTSGVNIEDYKFLEEADYKVEEFSETKDDKKFNGIKITKTFKNIDDITDEKELSLDFNELFDADNQKVSTDTKFFYKNGSNYVADFIFNLNDEDSESMDLSTFAKEFDLKYTVKLPNKSVSNNATSVSDDGMTLTWDLKYGQNNEVKYEFALDNSNTVLLISCIVLGIVVGGAIVVIISKKKETSN